MGVRSVCASTKLNQRYFYESFETADDLLVAALDQITTDLLTHGVAALHDTRYRSRLNRARHGLDVALGVILDDPRKATLLGAINAGPPRLQREYRRRVLQVSDAILADPDAVDVGFDQAGAIFVAAGTVQLTLAYVSGELDLDRDGLVDKLARLSMEAVTRR